MEDGAPRITGRRQSDIPCGRGRVRVPARISGRAILGYKRGFGKCIGVLNFPAMWKSL